VGGEIEEMPRKKESLSVEHDERLSSLRRVGGLVEEEGGNEAEKKRGVLRRPER